MQIVDLTGFSQQNSWITMYGGGNSHMAIRAAEYQLPAAIGVGVSLFKKLLISNLIELDCNKNNKNN